MFSLQLKVWCSGNEYDLILGSPQSKPGSGPVSGAMALLLGLGREML